MAEWKSSLEELLDSEVEALTKITDDDAFTAKVKRIRQVQVLLEEGKKTEQVDPQIRWLERHSDALIQAGVTAAGIIVIVVGEQLGPMLLNTKAWPFVPKPRF